MPWADMGWDGLTWPRYGLTWADMAGLCGVNLPSNSTFFRALASLTCFSGLTPPILA